MPLYDTRGRKEDERMIKYSDREIVLDKPNV